MRMSETNVAWFVLEMYQLALSNDQLVGRAMPPEMPSPFILLAKESSTHHQLMLCVCGRILDAADMVKRERNVSRLGK